MMIVLSYMMMGEVKADIPAWTFTPLTPTTQSVPSNSSGTIKYIVTNQSPKTHLLVMKPIQGVVQITTGAGVCSNPFLLLKKSSSCTLILQSIGSQLIESIDDGPVVCEQGSMLQCYRPNEKNILNITQTSPLPLPSNCMDTVNNNIQCKKVISGQINFGFTNMAYALCRSVQCNYQGTSPVVCNCTLIKAYQGVYSASTSPLDYTNSAPVGNTVTSTFSEVNTNGLSPSTCSSGPFANCYGARCTVNGKTVTCICPVETAPFKVFFPSQDSNCNLGPNLIWSATSISSANGIEGTMNYIYNTFFDHNTPN